MKIHVSELDYGWEFYIELLSEKRVIFEMDLDGNISPDRESSVAWYIEIWKLALREAEQTLKKYRSS